MIRELTAVQRFAARISRHTAVYSLPAVVTFAFGVLNVAVVTRYLSRPEFGQLAVLMVFTSLATVVYNLGSLQGSFSYIFGSEGDEAVDFDGPRHTLEPERGRREALGTGLIATAATGALGTLVMIAFARPLSHLLLGSDSHPEAVMWAAGAAALGAVWRLASNTTRLERRPGAYVLVFGARPALVLAGQWALVAAGHGITGAAAGLAAGNAVALLIALAAIRRSFRLRFRTGVLEPIYRLGAPFIILIAAFWAIQNAGLFILSGFASDSEVADYRVAMSIAAGMAYAVSAVTMASGPIRLTPLYLAVDRERGRMRANAAVAEYSLLGWLWILLGLTAVSPLLIKLVPSGYEHAALLIPGIALGYLAHGWFVSIYRAAEFHTRRRWLVAAAAVAALTYVPITLGLASAFGSSGVALSGLAAFSIAAGIMLWRSQRADTPIPFSWWRIAGGVSIAGGAYVLLRVSDGFAPALRVTIAAVLLAIFPLVLIGLGVIPRAHARALRSVLASLIPSRRRRTILADHVARLDARDRELLFEVCRKRTATEAVSSRLGIGRSELYRRVVHLLRSLDGDGDAPTTALDEAIGAYLTWTGSPADQDAYARDLWPRGVDPAELDRLVDCANAVRHLPRRAFLSPPRFGTPLQI